MATRILFDYFHPLNIETQPGSILSRYILANSLIE
jgi:hypothetical protein